MIRFFGGLALALAVLVVSGSARAFDEDTKKAQKDILDLTKKIEGGAKSVSEDAVKIKKKYEDLNTIMHAYKPSTKGGIGYGPKGAGDGIEQAIISLGKRANEATVKKMKDDLIKMANVNIAIAEITMEYKPAKPKGGKGAKEWKQHCDDMKKAAMELRDAAKGGDAKKVKAAANNLNTSCNNCHTDFRDS